MNSKNCCCFFFRGGGGGRGGVVYALKDVQNLIPRKYFTSFNVQNINYAMSPDMFTIDLSAFASYHNLSVKIGKYYPKIVNDIDMGVCHQCITFVPNEKKNPRLWMHFTITRIKRLIH